jgi:Uncharacterized protein with SCP/PR1 domains
MKNLIVTLLCLSTVVLVGQPSQGDIHRVMAEINLLRSQGYQCGEDWMPPAGPLKWNKELYRVSNGYARYMSKYHHFDHIDLQGRDLGDRLNKQGYDWVKIGENLGMGYDDFFTVMDAWKESPSHCAMLMDPDMTEVGLSKHRKYWVQSFSRAPSELAALGR